MLFSPKNKNVALKSDVTLDQIYSLLKLIENRLMDVEDKIDALQDKDEPKDTNKEELKELKSELKEKNTFIQQLVLRMLDGKDKAVAAITATATTPKSKIDEYIAKKNNEPIKLPG